MVEEPYKEKEYNLYALWSSMPLILRKMKPEQLESLGIDSEDVDFMALLKCSTKTAFCKEFKIDKATLWRWEQMPEFKATVNELSLQNNVLQYKKDIDLAFTMKTKNKADAPRVKLWYQIYQGWNERSQIQVGGGINVALVEFVGGEHDGDPDSVS